MLLHEKERSLSCEVYPEYTKYKKIQKNEMPKVRRSNAYKKETGCGIEYYDPVANPVET